MHFSASSSSNDNDEPALLGEMEAIIERLKAINKYLGAEPSQEEDVFSFSDEERKVLSEKLCGLVENLKEREINAAEEKERVKETLGEIDVFSKMNVSYSDFTNLSYLTLRLGRLDPKNHAALSEKLEGRAVIVSLEDGNRILAASSRKGRFALDSELKKYSFEPITIPEGYIGISQEMGSALRQQLDNIETELRNIASEKERIRFENSNDIRKLISSWQKALVIEKLKSRLEATDSAYMLSGWIPQDEADKAVKDLLDLSGGRAAIRSYNPEEISAVRNGREKVPVLLKHGAIVKGFEGMVASYGTPPYGTIDPTPLVAFFYTILFGIMFGDLGQGFVLLLLGFLAGSRGLKAMARFRKYSTPLVCVGITSMIMGILNGAVFANEELLVAPTRAISAAITGSPVDRVLYILPIAEKGGSLKKLFYFFGFTIAIGVILNTIGMIINIFNRCIMKKYEDAFLSKTGLAGLLLFWYIIFIAVRILLGGHFEWYDALFLSIPFFCILFGPVVMRCISADRKVLEHGLFTFIVEIFVEALETASIFFSNTISFVRVGAFALSHAVLSYVVFYFTEHLAVSGSPAGSISAVLLVITGNAVIIVLEGLIVAIQVVRLQYCEFFSKFFFENGVAFAPFRFSRFGL
jgi:V/A-type H+-transporting ATPase subunit I